MPHDERPQGPDSVRVLVKAMAVLELLAESPGAMSLQDISGRLNLNKSTCYRILSTLSSGEFVERAGPGSYQLGIGTFRVGSAMGRRMKVHERVLPAMQDLYKATGETVFLCIPRGDEAVCVGRLDGRYASTHTLRIGSALALHVGAAPRILLAARPDEEIDEYLERTPGLPVTPDEFRSQVQQIRANETAVSRDDVEEGVTAFGAPVRDLTGQVVAAISLSGLTMHLPDESDSRMLSVIRDAATRASHALGHR